MIIPSLGGVTCFGLAVHIRHVPSPPVLQRDHYFGVSGSTSLYGGQPGRRFEVSGCLAGTTLGAAIGAESVLLGLGDGLGRTLIDTQGRVWYTVLLVGYEPSGGGPVQTDWGWVLPYSCTLEGLQ